MIFSVSGKFLGNYKFFGWSYLKWLIRLLLIIRVSRIWVGWSMWCVVDACCIVCECNLRVTNQKDFQYDNVQIIFNWFLDIRIRMDVSWFFFLKFFFFLQNCCWAVVTISRLELRVMVCGAWYSILQQRISVVVLEKCLCKMVMKASVFAQRELSRRI